MNIILNNNKEEIITDKEKLSVEELLEIKKFSFRMLVVRINGKLVKKEDYASSFIKEGDNVQVLHLMSGG